MVCIWRGAPGAERWREPAPACRGRAPSTPLSHRHARTHRKRASVRTHRSRPDARILMWHMPHADCMVLESRAARVQILQGSSCNRRADSSGTSLTQLSSLFDVLDQQEAAEPAYCDMESVPRSTPCAVVLHGSPVMLMAGLEHVSCTRAQCRPFCASPGGCQSPPVPGLRCADRQYSYSCMYACTVSDRLIPTNDELVIFRIHTVSNSILC